MDDIESAKAYLVEKRLPEIVDDMTGALVASKPADPLSFISEWAAGKTPAGGKPTLYILGVSANSLQVVAFIADAGIDVEIKPMDAMSGEHKKPEFLAINPSGQLPALTDGDFCLSESMAIMRYLCNKFKIGAPWYPTSAQERGLVDRAMDWRQTVFYKHLSEVSYPFLGFSQNRALVPAAKKKLDEACKVFTEKMLSKGGFLLGTEPCIADYAIAVPLEFLPACPDYKLPVDMQEYLERFTRKCPKGVATLAPMKGYVSQCAGNFKKDEVVFYSVPVSANSVMVELLLHDMEIEHETKALDLMAGEHKQPEFLKINPMGQVPAIKDNDLCMGESCSIMRYLCNKSNVGAPLYPTDPAARAKVDMALDWRQIVYYPAISELTYFALGFVQVDSSEPAKAKLTAACEHFVEHICKKDAFIAGDEPCIADYAVVIPLEYTKLIPSWTCPPAMVAYWDRFVAKSPNYSKQLETLRGYVQSKMEAPPAEA